ncbi:hypothetical protein LR013_02125 [candidate division NPL-UPA2 bacterium]|nr:hypothetical protein [candidate division NPL-UPA2 bacterium]
MANKRRSRFRRRTRFSPPEALLGLVLFLIVSFLLLDFFHFSISSINGERRK